MPTIAYTTTLQTTTCWCGIYLAVPQALLQQAFDSGLPIYCPLGHPFAFGDTYKEKYEQERRRKAATRELLKAEERAHAATRGHLTRQKKRAAAGLCPCCRRTFQQLARHMKTKHPGYGKNGAAS